MEDIRGFTEDDGDEDVRFYNYDPPGSEVLSWLASAPSRRVNPPTPPPPALNGSWIFFCCSSSAGFFFMRKIAASQFLVILPETSFVSVKNSL